jgi:hypothetical protein
VYEKERKKKREGLSIRERSAFGSFKTRLLSSEARKRAIKAIFCVKLTPAQFGF